MKTTGMKIVAVAVALLSTAWASPMSQAVRAMIPSDVRQIISVDYLTVKNSGTAMELKAQVLPDNLKEFESAFKDVGINADRDLESITFASFDVGKLGLKMVGIASGTFSSKTILTKVDLDKIKPEKYRASDLYPLSKTMTMTCLDDKTVLFGDADAVKTVLNVRSGGGPRVDSNQEVAHMIQSVEKAPVWSVLDQQASQNMLVSVLLGKAGKLPDFESIKTHVLGSRYMMNFKNGFSLYVDVLTSDISTSASLSSLLKAGVLYKKVTATPAQKVALENLRVASDHLTTTSPRSHLKMQFKVDQKQFQNLLRSQCFSAVSGERKELSGVTSAPLIDGQKPDEISLRQK